MVEGPSTEKKLQAVIKSARAILEKESFHDAARAIFDCCCEMTGAVSGYVALISSDGYENELLFLEAGGLPCSVDPHLPMPIRGLREEAYRTHKAVYENDFMGSEWTDYLPDGHVEMRNVMFAPLNLDGATVGVIGVANKPGPFTDDDAQIATVFGELAAIALKNSQHIDLLEEKTTALEKALGQVRTLKGLIPICTNCKNIRDDAGFWKQVDIYITEHTDTQFSHGMCPDCLRKQYPEDAEEIIAAAEQFKRESGGE